MESDHHCRFHPDRPQAAPCQKYGHGLCAQCLEEAPHCPDPDLYCKFRPQCVIHFRIKEMRRQDGPPEES